MIILPKRDESRKLTRNTKKSSRILIRPLKSEEIESTAALVARLKRLNGEFDPLLRTSDDVEEQAVKTVNEALTNKSSVVLIAMVNDKVAGVVKADLIDRIFYEPRKEGSIIEFYILPEFRRSNLGKDLVEAISKRLREKGAELITAEFPSQNEIAKRFYSKLGFRSVTNVYAKAEP